MQCFEFDEVCTSVVRWPNVLFSPNGVVSLSAVFSTTTRTRAHARTLRASARMQPRAHARVCRHSHACAGLRENVH
eukprot:6212113-Pleurochrysis_carterae.AAC.1